MRKKVLVAMSGGVDSSVAALILKKEGCAVTGVTMCLGVKEPPQPRRLPKATYEVAEVAGVEKVGERKPSCCGAKAIEDAKSVSRKLNIPHYVMDFSNELERDVVSRFVSEYASGRTPNPCVDCNRSLKFGALLKKALSLGFDFLATGHYARIERKKEFYLKKAKDKRKDQSYFLYPIKKENLKFILFPLGAFTKDKVRDIASSAELPVADKPESQDICFIPERNHRDFLSLRMGEKVEEGPILTLEGSLLGRHKGALFYTIGQRSGLGIGYKEPLYVLSVDAKKNQLVVGEKKYLKSIGLTAGNANILVRDLPEKASAKIRYSHKDAKCRVALGENGKLEVIFEEPQDAVTAGQSVVLYDGDTVLAGGVIEKSIRRNR